MLAAHTGMAVGAARIGFDGGCGGFPELGVLPPAHALPSVWIKRFVTGRAINRLEHGLPLGARQVAPRNC